VSWYQKGKTNLDFTEARDSEWQWHQLGRMQVCTSLQTDHHTSTPPLSFLQAGCPSCRPTNSVKALNGKITYISLMDIQVQPRSSAVNVTLPAFPAKRRAAAPLLLGAGVCYRSMYLARGALSSKSVARHRCCRSIGQTDWRTRTVS